MVIRVLNVAEKPTVAKEISNILSKGKCSKSAGRSKYNPIWKFPFTLRGQEVEMIVTSVLGHLMARDFAGNLNKWWACEPNELFDAPIQQFVPQVGKLLLNEFFWIINIY